MRAARIAAVVLVGFGVVVYSAWLLEFFVPTGGSAAEDRVLVAPLFRVTTGGAGLAFLLAGPPLMRLAPVHWTGRLTAGSVSALGAVLVAEALAPGPPVVRLFVNLVFVTGSLSLVLWWPPGWRAWAVAGLVLVLVTWALAQLGPKDLEGAFLRAQLVVRAVLLAVGIAYVVVMPHPPAPRAR